MILLSIKYYDDKGYLNKNKTKNKIKTINTNRKEFVFHKYVCVCLIVFGLQ